MEYKNVGKFYDGVRRRMDTILEKKPNIPDGVKQLIGEIVIRRCEEFSLSAPELNRDIDSLTAFLDTVEFGKMIEGYERASGLFSTTEKRVLIGQEYLNGLRREIVNDVSEDFSNGKAHQTLTHEMYHPMSKRPDGEDRMTHYSKYTGERMVSLKEIITEVSATRSCESNSEENFMNGIRVCKGYGDLTFSLGVMAATFGMTEKEFLKGGMEGYNELKTRLIKSAGTKEAYTDFTDLDIITEKMHSQLYPWQDQVRPTPEQLSTNITSDMRSMITTSQESFRNRALSSDKPLEELSAELLYNQNKLEKNLEYGINGFATRIGKENAKDLYARNKILSFENKKIVRGLARVLENKEQMDPELYEKALTDIRSGKILMDYEKYAQEYGLESISELATIPSKVPESYMAKVRKDDFDNGRKWDNREILQNIRDNVINNRFVHRIEDTVLHSRVAFKNGLKTVFGREVLALPPAREPEKLQNGQADKNSDLQINEAPKEAQKEQDLSFGELPSEQKRIAQEGYLDALRAIHTKESGIEERPGKDDNER